MMKHNIFQFATSELSNDAVLCWILNGFKHKDSSIEFKKVAGKLLELLTCEFNQDYVDIYVDKQHKINVNDKKRFYIDIYIELISSSGLKHNIIIEDKVHANESGNQLEEYKKYFDSNGEHNRCVFIVIGNRSKNYINKIESKGWKVITRSKLLSCFDFNYEDLYPNEGLLIQYKEYLSNIENEFNEFNKIDVEKWNYNTIQGFFQSLEKNNSGYDWGYVNNQRGGFWAMWYNKQSFLYENETRFSIYLQLEFPIVEKSKIKISIKYTCDDYDKLKTKDYQNLIKKTNEFREIIVKVIDGTFFTVPKGRNGRTMTLAYKQLSKNNENPNLKDLKEILFESEKSFIEIIKKLGAHHVEVF